MSDLDEAGLGPPGVGEGSRLEAEQLGFEEGGRDRRAVDLDERTTGARTGVVEGPGEEPLAGPGLALEKDRGSATSASELRQQALDRRPNGRDAGALAQETGQGTHDASAPTDRIWPLILSQRPTARATGEDSPALARSRLLPPPPLQSS